jgi:hypothetical protein
MAQSARRFVNIVSLKVSRRQAADRLGIVVQDRQIELDQLDSCSKLWQIALPLCELPGADSLRMHPRTLSWQALKLRGLASAV